MSILHTYNLAARSAAQRQPAAGDLPALSPQAFLSATRFDDAEISGAKNRRLAGWGSVTDAQGQSIGDLLVDGGFYLIGEGGKARKLNDDDRIAAAQIGVRPSQPAGTFRLSLQKDDWREQIIHRLPPGSACVVRVTLPAPRNVTFDFPAARQSAPSHFFNDPVAPCRASLTAASDLRLIGFHAPDRRFGLPPGLSLRGIARRKDGVHIGGKPIMVIGDASVEVAPVMAEKNIMPVRAEARPIEGINGFFQMLDC